MSSAAQRVFKPEPVVCQSCASSRMMEINGEICLQFQGGLKSLDKPLIWVFPKVIVCLDCGSAQFAVPETELKLIEKSA